MRRAWQDWAGGGGGERTQEPGRRGPGGTGEAGRGARPTSMCSTPWASYSRMRAAVSWWPQSWLTTMGNASGSGRYFNSKSKQRLAGGKGRVCKCEWVAAALEALCCLRTAQTRSGDAARTAVYWRT